MDPYTRLAVKKYKYEQNETPERGKPKNSQASRQKKTNPFAYSNRKVKRDQQKPHLPRDHRDDVPVKDVYDDEDAPQTEKKQEDGKNLVKYKDDYGDEKQNNYEEDKNVDAEKSREQQTHTKQMDEEDEDNSGYQTEKLRRFSTIGRPAYERDNRINPAEPEDEKQRVTTANDEHIKPKNGAKQDIFARDSKENAVKLQITTAKQRNEFDQYDNFKTRGVPGLKNFYLTHKEKEVTAREDSPPENERLKAEFVEAPVVNISDENDQYSEQRDSVQSDTNYDAFNEAKQPVLETVLSQKLHGRAIATSGTHLLVDPHSQTPWFESHFVTHKLN